jgi:hypothetical protein
VVDSGAAYVFHYDGSQWLEEKLLTASDGAHADNFGSEVAISGTTILVGAQAHDAAGDNAGAAYLFEFDGSTWQETAKIQATDAHTDDLFGWSGAVDGSTLVVGAPNQTGSVSRAGAAYVYRKRAGSWLPVQKLIAAEAASDSLLGHAVALQGNTALIGSVFEANAGAESGALYAFELPPFYLSAPNASLTAGDVLQLSACGGNPGAPVGLALTQIAGFDLFRFLQFGVLDSQGEWTTAFQVPLEAMGMDPRFQAFTCDNPTSHQGILQSNELPTHIQ